MPTKLSWNYFTKQDKTTKLAQTLGDIPFKEAKERASNKWAIKTIQAALSQSNGNVSEAARHLKMSRTALIRLINKYNLRSSD